MKVSHVRINETVLIKSEGGEDYLLNSSENNIARVVSFRILYIEAFYPHEQTASRFDLTNERSLTLILLTFKQTDVEDVEIISNISTSFFD